MLGYGSVTPILRMFDVGRTKTFYTEKVTVIDPSGNRLVFYADRESEA